MTGRVLLAIVVLLVVGAPCAAAEVIRDVGPTTLERGDTLVVECEGIPPGEAARVTITASGERILLDGRSARGDRVLVTIDDGLAGALGGSRRLAAAGVEVEAAGRRWTLRPGETVTFELFPASLRSLATAAAARASAFGPLGGAAALAGVVLLVALALHLMIAPLTGLVVVWERKISGRMQSRLGPNRVGPGGWLQWLADAIKMITKEDLVPAEADATLFRLSPYLMWMSVFATFVVLPLSQTAIVADMNVGLLYLTSITSLTVIAILIGGWASNSKWSLLGGMRSAAQIVSYELPASLALLQIALQAGTLSPQAIVRAQGGLPHQWYLFSNPLTFVCFFVYFISALAEGNRAPFDLPEAESELVSGYSTEYSGFRFGIFSLAEWTNLYVMSAVAATMFLGGWNVPFVAPESIAGSFLLQVLSLGTMTVKIVGLVFVIIWIRWTLPRFRVDQMMALCWKYFVPITFVAFLGTAAWLWAVARLPWLDPVMRGLVFVTGGLGVLGLFVVRVIANLRATKLLYLGDDQLTLPFIERPVDRTR